VNEKTIDLNCDLGEGFPHDAALMPLISSANIACGGHAGDASTMAATVSLAIGHGVAVGAHPGYADREHFGRREQPLDPTATAALVLEQVELLARIAGRHLRHVKLHGALYHAADRDADIAAAISDALAARWPALIVFARSGGLFAERAQRAGLRVAAESFVDRRYGPDGGLVPRSDPRAVIAAADDVAAQAIGLVLDSRVAAVDGTVVPVRAETLCIHGDAADPVGSALAVRRACDRLGVAVRAPRPDARDSG
jgi:UPF0271 protein